MDFYCDRDSMIYTDESIIEITNKLINSLYEELDEFILACMVAGVPLNKMILSEPKLITENYIVRLQSALFFK